MSTFLCRATVCLFSFVVLSSAGTRFFPPLGDTAWATVAPEALGWQTSMLEPLYEYLDSNDTRAFIVLKGGKIAIEKYFGTFTKDSLWYWASAGKTITALTVGIALQEKLLTLGDRTSKWLGSGWTSCTSGQESLITLRHQLTMTSGLDDAVTDPFCTDPACLSYRADAGTRWAYHNGPYTLLDKVIETAAGRTMNAYFAAKVRNRIGMNGAFVKSGYNNVYYSTARSMARFGLLILNRGNWDGTTILSDTAYFRQMTTPSQDINKSYGYLWWLNGKTSHMVPQSQVVFPGPLCPNAPPDMIAALGKNGQFIDVAPSLDLVFVRMGDVPVSVDVPFLMNDEIWKMLNPVIGTNAIHRAQATTRILPSTKTNALPRIYDIRGKLLRGDYRSSGSGIVIRVLGRASTTLCFCSK